MKVYIGSAIWRSVEPLHMKALMPLLRDPDYEYWPQIGDACMERVRGISATYFLRHTDADVHLSLDSDIIEFEKDVIDKMCEQAERYDIVGAVYICRSTSRTFPATFFNDGGVIEFAFDPTPKPVQWVATGCLAVHRRVFERMAETMPLLHERDGKRAFYDFYETMHYDTKDMGLIKLTEDYAFSQRAKDLGFTSYINPAVRVGHMGPYAYRLEDMAQTVLEPQPMKLERRGTVWRVECAMNEETPEGKGEEIRAKFSRAERRRNQRKEKALTKVT
jgi:hypothetical protein